MNIQQAFLKRRKQKFRQTKRELKFERKQLTAKKKFKSREQLAEISEKMKKLLKREEYLKKRLADIILIPDQPVDNLDSYRSATLRQITLKCTSIPAVIFLD